MYRRIRKEKYNEQSVRSSKFALRNSFDSGVDLFRVLLSTDRVIGNSEYALLPEQKLLTQQLPKGLSFLHCLA